MTSDGIEPFPYNPNKSLESIVAYSDSFYNDKNPKRLENQTFFVIAPESIRVLNKDGDKTLLVVEKDNVEVKVSERGLLFGMKVNGDVDQFKKFVENAANQLKSLKINMFDQMLLNEKTKDEEPIEGVRRIYEVLNVQMMSGLPKLKRDCLYIASSFPSDWTKYKKMYEHNLEQLGDGCDKYFAIQNRVVKNDQERFADLLKELQEKANKDCEGCRGTKCRAVWLSFLRYLVETIRLGDL